MKTSQYKINLNTITWEATDALLKLDETFIGTPNYMGLGYFWGWSFRHYLRDASIIQRVSIHERFLKAGLSVDGESERHWEIIIKVLKINDSFPKTDYESTNHDMFPENPIQETKEVLSEVDEQIKILKTLPKELSIAEKYIEIDRIMKAKQIGISKFDTYVGIKRLNNG